MLLKRGAEAELYLDTWYGRKVVVKRRIRKGYRIRELDEEIRSTRTSHEAAMMHKAKECGVSTPIIFLVDLTDKSIMMEYIEGVRLKDVLDSLPKEERRRILIEVGRMIGAMHKRGLIHGDLTTSNMILDEGRIYFIDFGLSEVSEELEDKGVDLHLMKRALESTHHLHSDEYFSEILLGYSEVVGEDEARKVLSKIEEIAKRGRYVSGR
ncbi:Kae1-associated serine/threonine protein kinase [Candidatus Bathyarchaeota archaeon]|nr:Kae1-associated serine/threonine protein kinase [Candidatus Bathyarchaeota archaeon]